MQMQTIQFSKMHGLGNDFVVVNSLANQISFSPEQIRKLSDRHLGIGFDQLLVIESVKGKTIFCRIYNSDGSEARQCGNGLRCVARFIYDAGICTDSQFEIETIAGVYPVN